jgi:asparagine synthetase B (glutamine-hydrolysing)
MCGIAEIWNFKGQMPSKSLSRFTNFLTQRSPDGVDFHLNYDACIGFDYHRLATPDISKNGDIWNGTVIRDFAKDKIKNKSWNLVDFTCFWHNIRIICKLFIRTF